MVKSFIKPDRIGALTLRSYHIIVVNRIGVALHVEEKVNIFLLPLLLTTIYMGKNWLFNKL